MFKSQFVIGPKKKKKEKKKREKELNLGGTSSNE
jgi:hypothetical protein